MPIDGKVKMVTGTFQKYWKLHVPLSKTEYAYRIVEQHIQIRALTSLNWISNYIELSIEEYTQKHKVMNENVHRLKRIFVFTSLVYIISIKNNYLFIRIQEVYIVQHFILYWTIERSLTGKLEPGPGNEFIYTWFYAFENRNAPFYPKS